MLLAWTSIVSANAQGLPIIGTPTSTVLNQQQVRIDFTANSNGSSTQLWIQYSTNTAFTGTALKTVAGPTLPAGTNGNQSITISGLVANTLYYYRVRAQNGNGEMYSINGSFTPGAKPMISSVASNVLSATSANASFVISAGTSATNYSVEYSTNSSISSPEVASDGGTIDPNTSSPTINITLVSLVPNTMYYYRIKAFNSFGTVYSPTASFTTQAAATPPVITNVVSTVLSATSARIGYSVTSTEALVSLALQYCADSLFTTGVTTAVNVFNSVGAHTQTLTGLTADTRYYYRVKAENAGGITYSPKSKNFKTPGLPVVSNVVSRALSTTTGQVTFDLDPNGYDTQYSVIYSPNSTFSSIVDSISAGLSYLNGAQTRKARIIGLTPGLTYYKVKATNAAGRVQSTVGTFIIPSTNPTPALIAEYKFNNSYLSESGNMAFGSSGPSFVADRASFASSAIGLTTGGTSAVIPNLPAGAYERTISFWVKANAFNSTGNTVFTYGTGQEALTFWIGSTYLEVNQDFVTSVYTTNTTHQTNTWYHYVFTYDGTNGKIYRNGALLTQGPMALSTDFNGGTFRIGSRGYTPDDLNGAIDDLKIYNYALNSTDVASLHANNVITSIENNIETTISLAYPNPAKDILHVSGSSEIFDLVGNKVASGSTEINIEHLLSGIYVVKANGRSQKIVKE